MRVQVSPSAPRHFHHFPLTLMRSSFLLLALVLLSGCSTSSVSQEDVSRANSSSSAHSIAIETDASSSGTVLPTLLAFRASFSDTVFTEPSRVLYKDSIQLSSTRTLPARTVQGYAIVTKDGHLERDQMTVVADWAKKNGWTASPLLSADGPTGSIWGYKKEIAQGTQILIIQSHRLCDNDAKNCKKERREVVFVSDPIEKKDLINHKL